MKAVQIPVSHRRSRTALPAWILAIPGLLQARIPRRGMNPRMGTTGTW
jgi:hypothetical protein